MLYGGWIALVRNKALSSGPTHGGSPRFCRITRQVLNRLMVELSALVASPGSPTSLLMRPLYAGSSSATVHCVAPGGDRLPNLEVKIGNSYSIVLCVTMLVTLRICPGDDTRATFSVCPTTMDKEGRWRLGL